MTAHLPDAPTGLSVPNLNHPVLRPDRDLLTLLIDTSASVRGEKGRQRTLWTQLMLVMLSGGSDSARSHNFLTSLVWALHV
jgi:hypothetical protein